MSPQNNNANIVYRLAFKCKMIKQTTTGWAQCMYVVRKTTLIGKANNPVNLKANERLYAKLLLHDVTCQTQEV